MARRAIWDGERSRARSSAEMGARERSMRAQRMRGLEADADDEPTLL